MIRTVIFDLGKVLVDYSFENTYKYWSEKSGVPIKLIKAHFSADEHYKQHEVGGISIDEYWQYLCGRIGMNISLEDFSIGWNAMLIGLYPKTVSILKRITQNAQKALLSNTNETHTVYLRDNFTELFNNLDLVFFSNEIKKRKPNEETFRYVIDKCGVKPDELLFFDDLEENIIGARKLGINCVLVDDPNNIESELIKYQLL
jgi:putative hydrolase of the HAD superfamily